MKYLRDSEVKQYRDANLPPICPILGIPMDKPVLDHDHKTGKVRGVISNQANILLGRIENYLDHRVSCGQTTQHVLLQLFSYVGRDQENNPFHPEGLRQVCRRFNTLKKDDQIRELLEIGIPRETINECSNSRKRTNLYRKYLKGEL